MRHIQTITDKDITGSEALSTAEPRVAVNAILFDADKNIALSYMGKFDLHTLPGGGVDHGEDLLAAVKREMLEETGCRCEILGELGQIFENRSEHDFTQERYYFVAKVVGDKGNLHLTEEEIESNTSVEWHPLEQALDIIASKQRDNYQQKFIQKRDIVALNEAFKWVQLHDIPNYDSFTKIDPITKGWSEDKKYCITKADGMKYLLRITPIARYEQRKSLFAMLEQVAALGIPMCAPVEFGTCADGAYSIQSWINGDDLETILPSLSETEQYVLGLKSGEILRKMHSIPAPQSQEAWELRFNRKTDMKIQKYHECGLRFDGDTHVLSYIEQNRHLLKDRPQCFQHGDYHTGNMMLENGELKIIDFDRYDFGDPWEEFNRIVFSALLSPHFASGQIHGYFDEESPLEFFKLLAYYISVNIIASLPWAISFGQSDVEFMIKLSQTVLLWHDNMQNPVPTWYLKDFYIQWTDGVPYKLKEPYDFSFLSKYGRVFKVFDDQDSGNICFGMINGDVRRFIKFAGAPTERSNVSSEEAIERMKTTVPIYHDLAHPTLIRLISTEETEHGIVMVFDWLDSECMGRQYPQSREKFMKMPIETRLCVFDEILSFHAHVIQQGYVAIDFYDGCIIYDFDAEKTSICDIELYAKMPYKNSMGRMYGSSRFMSPEEFRLGADIDEVTNVYTMGATAFALFGDERDRCEEKWNLSKTLFDVAKRAVSDERSQRQQTIEQFISEWEAAR